MAVTTSIGANLDYTPSTAHMTRFLKELTSDKASASSGGGYKRKPRFCVKVSATAPQDDTADDLPESLYDICLHYNAAGVYQDTYMATGGDPGAGTTTWTKIID